MNISNSNAPITVLMPVYNAERYVGEAIESILNQTFRDFKFLIIDDGSTDRSCEIIRAYSLEDHRIELVINESNMGITKTLNKGLSMIDTPYIARMDSDDISLPHRFEKQLDIMENNSDIDVCGTWFEFFENNSGMVMHPERDEDIKLALLFYCSLGHPTVMLRNETLKRNNFEYSTCAKDAEDYDLWVRMATTSTFYNIQESLLRYRVHGDNISVKKANTQYESFKKSRDWFLSKLGVVDSQLIEILNKDRYACSVQDLNNIQKILVSICQANKKQKLFNQHKLETMASNKFFSYCFYSTRHGFLVYNIFFSSSFHRFLSLSVKKKIEFFMRAWLRIKK